MAQESWKKETDQTECETPDSPILCANNCGFFGSAVTNNLCSKCYKDLIMKHKSIVIPPAPGIEKTNLPSSSVKIAISLDSSDRADGTCATNAVKNQVEDLSHKQPASRCLQCQKRVGLTGFKCRCGGTFCSVHRYYEAHECSFDYKTVGREAIAKDNPVVKADKIEKI